MWTMPGHRSCLLAAWGLWMILWRVAFPHPAYAQSDVTVALESPQPGAQVQGEVELVGTVRGTDFQRYELHYRPAGTDQEYIYFEGDQVQIESGVLGRWSTGTLAPGDYEIRLQVILGDQQVAETTVTVTLIPEGTAAAANSEADAAPASTAPVLQEDASLRQALDQLALRARPAALWAYLQRGMRWSGMVVAAVMAYFGLKALLLSLIRRMQKP